MASASWKGPLPIKRCFVIKYNKYIIIINNIINNITKTCLRTNISPGLIFGGLRCIYIYIVHGRETPTNNEHVLIFHK